VNSLKMVSTSAGTFATERVAVTPGSTHAISAFINQSVASGARITVWQLQSGTFIANSPLVSTTGSYTSIATPTFTVPAGVNAILIGLQISPSTGGTVYWDDVSMS
jgi:hypothetical protein